MDVEHKKATEKDILKLLKESQVTTIITVANKDFNIITRCKKTGNTGHALYMIEGLSKATE